MEYIKQSQIITETEDKKIRHLVETMLSRIRSHGESAVVEYAQSLDGHARACDWRLKKYFPDNEWNFHVSFQQRYE